MNLIQLSQQFEFDDDGRNSSAVRRWVRALMLSVTRRTGGKRRPAGLNSRQLESLEVRQVLSVANPMSASIDVIVSSDDTPVDVRILSAGTNGNSDLQPPVAVNERSEDRIPGDDPEDNDVIGSYVLDPSFEISDPAIDAAATETQDDPNGSSVSIDFPAALIDEVFRKSQSILGDSPWLTGETFPIGSRDLFRESNRVDDQIGALAGSSTASIRPAALSAREAQFLVRPVEASRKQFADAEDSVQIDRDRGLFVSDSFATTTQGADLGAVPWRLFGSAIRESQSVATTSSVKSSAIHTNWLTWLTERTSAIRVSPHDFGLESPLDNKLLRDAVPLLCESSNPPQVLQATVSNAQTQARKFRENHRQSTVRNPDESTAPDQYEPPRLLDLDSVPRQLKFFVDPRGPPIYGRDADVPFAETNAPADLLERLRYSITPRGPSLVTVEMQSPEFLSFSGPGVSLKELRYELAG